MKRLWYWIFLIFNLFADNPLKDTTRLATDVTGLIMSKYAPKLLKIDNMIDIYTNLNKISLIPIPYENISNNIEGIGSTMGIIFYISSDTDTLGLIEATDTITNQQITNIQTLSLSWEEENIFKNPQSISKILISTANDNPVQLTTRLPENSFIFLDQKKIRYNLLEPKEYIRLLKKFLALFMTNDDFVENSGGVKALYDNSIYLIKKYQSILKNNPEILNEKFASYIEGSDKKILNDLLNFEVDFQENSSFSSLNAINLNLLRYIILNYYKNNQNVDIPQNNSIKLIEYENMENLPTSSTFTKFVPDENSESLRDKFLAKIYANDVVFDIFSTLTHLNISFLQNKITLLEEDKLALQKYISQKTNILSQDLQVYANSILSLKYVYDATKKIEDIELANTIRGFANQIYAVLFDEKFKDYISMPATYNMSDELKILNLATQLETLLLYEKTYQELFGSFSNEYIVKIKSILKKYNTNDKFMSKADQEISNLEQTLATKLNPNNSIKVKFLLFIQTVLQAILLVIVVFNLIYMTYTLIATLDFKIEPFITFGRNTTIAFIITSNLEYVFYFIHGTYIIFLDFAGDLIALSTPSLEYKNNLFVMVVKSFYIDGMAFLWELFLVHFAIFSEICSGNLLIYDINKMLIFIYGLKISMSIILILCSATFYAYFLYFIFFEYFLKISISVLVSMPCLFIMGILYDKFLQSLKTQVLYVFNITMFFVFWFIINEILQELILYCFLSLHGDTLVFNYDPHYPILNFSLDGIKQLIDMVQNINLNPTSRNEGNIIDVFQLCITYLLCYYIGGQITVMVMFIFVLYTILRLIFPSSQSVMIDTYLLNDINVFSIFEDVCLIIGLYFVTYEILNILKFVLEYLTDSNLNASIITAVNQTFKQGKWLYGKGKNMAIQAKDAIYETGLSIWQYFNKKPEGNEKPIILPTQQPSNPNNESTNQPSQNNIINRSDSNNNNTSENQEYENRTNNSLNRSD